jgi:multiple antibiotic resistance protein
MDLRQIFSVSLILFSVIDILGALPIIIKLKADGKKIEPLKVTFVSGAIMVGFLFTGEGILRLLNLDVESFALAGAFVLFLIGIEMILGIVLFKDTGMNDKPSVVPLAFPLIAGAGKHSCWSIAKFSVHIFHTQNNRMAPSSIG